MSERAVFLFDGPNFYRNIKRANLDRGHLDYMKLARNLAGPRTISEVVFFTSPVDQSTEPANYANQRRFFARLQASGVTLRLGHLVGKEVKCDACGVTTRIKGEKSLDVQLALALVVGAMVNQWDVAYLASCDSDLIPAIDHVQLLGKRVFLIFPDGSRCHNVARACDVRIPITQKTLDEAQA